MKSVSKKVMAGLGVGAMSLSGLGLQVKQQLQRKMHIILFIWQLIPT